MRARPRSAAVLRAVDIILELASRYYIGRHSERRYGFVCWAVIVRSDQGDSAGNMRAVFDTLHQLIPLAIGRRSELRRSGNNS